MGAILKREKKGTGEEVYQYFDTRIDEIMEENLKAKKIFLTESEKEKINQKYPLEEGPKNMDELHLTAGLCHWEILDLVDICGYLLSTTDNLIYTHALKGFKKNKKDKKAFSKIEIDCAHDLEEELKQLNNTVKFINEMVGTVIKEINGNKEENTEN